MNYITNPLITANYSAYRLPQVVKAETSTVAPETQAPVAPIPVPQTAQTEAVIVDFSPELSNTFALIDEGQFSEETQGQTEDGTVDNDSATSLAGIKEEEEDEKKDDPAAKTGVDGNPLSKAEENTIKQLVSRDKEVRAHENAHIAAGGGLTGAPSFVYEIGPDGVRYAVGGSVHIDTSPGRNPQETLMKADRIMDAALAPGNPSAQDRAVAARASQMAAEARSEILKEKQIAPQELEQDPSAVTAGLFPVISSTAKEMSDFAKGLASFTRPGDTPETADVPKFVSTSQSQLFRG
jgi:hypothetical protein